MMKTPPVQKLLNIIKIQYFFKWLITWVLAKAVLSEN